MNNKMTFGFGKLEVWQKAIDLEKDVYDLTEKCPQQENFVIISQLRKSAVSISSYIAKGSAQQTNLEKAKFSNFAYTNVYEVVSLLDFLHKLQNINDEQLAYLKLNLDTLAKMIAGLRKSQLVKSNI